MTQFIAVHGQSVLTGLTEYNEVFATFSYFHQINLKIKEHAMKSCTRNNPMIISQRIVIFHQNQREGTLT